jgi:hypothetical protein
MTVPAPFSTGKNIQGLYRHYKDKSYRVLGAAKHTETLEDMVVYQALYGDYKTWIRPAAMFFEMVQTTEGEVPRFTKIDGETQ